MANSKALVGIIMGSDSDLPVMQAAADMLNQFSIPFELTVVSAHRTPLRMVSYAQEAAGRGLKVIIAGAGGAAHLPGMVASITPLPVIGVPIKSSNSIDGWDSVLSILQMPNGVPVATVALNAAKNAGILAAQIIGADNKDIQQKVASYKAQLENEVLEKVSKLQKEGWSNGYDI
ncbi:MAG: 5-(carboxyamino)imidazole ribonucleotide mutase [Sphingobacteriales bacterium]|jgi:5-(carboxyamino)imidazole ribonucleotide mutase|nr:5-(carboxyamino)imidazole ribonucleotide mutase [Sphingobacteriales bacterium]NCT73261.1 5-(carboxyamino)imidazole ribonucleotide mutase [Chitinophagaceae bacterium]OJW35242.1 MAG: 5-(carboxyamino)imidazole ribonucleotide mutase [Sphingobacteriales bacterium 46-32]